MDSVSEKLVDFADRTEFADLTPSAIHAVKRSVVDSMGCLFGAFHEETCELVRAVATRSSSTPPASIIGTTMKSSIEMAGLVNATTIRYADFSDDYFGPTGSSGPHPSDNIGAVLAATESVGGSAEDFILGVVVAYEVCAQLADHIPVGGKTGWDYSFFHAAASAVATGTVLGLNRDQLADALGIAAVANLSSHETRLSNISNWKAIAGPNASRNGLFAAILAKEGVTGPSEPFEGVAGVMRMFNARFELDELGGNGVPFKIEGTYMKAIPIRYTLQLPVSNAFEIRKLFAIEDVESIDVYMMRRFATDPESDPAAYDPQSRETADHSGPYLIALALIEGEITEKAFTTAYYRNPDILSLVQKIRILADEQYSALFPETFKSRIEVKLKSGEVVSLEYENPKGHPGNPMSDDDLSKKFLKQAVESLSSQQAESLLGRLWKLEEFKNVMEPFEGSEVSR